jgi:hypothetical protein
MVGRSDEVYASEIFETLLVIDAACEFSGHTESNQSMRIRHWDGELVKLYAACDFLLTHSYCERPIDDADEDSVLGSKEALLLLNYAKHVYTVCKFDARDLSAPRQARQVPADRRRTQTDKCQFRKSHYV